MVKEEKLKAVEALKQRISGYPVIGLLDIAKLPTKQFQEIQKKMRGQVDIVITKKSILTNALMQSGKQNIEKINEMIGKSMPGLVLTNDDPFKFYMRVSKMKSPTYAKGGETAEEDVVIPAGPTGIMAGPAISEFSKLKVPAGVEEGKISVKKETTVVKKGGVINKELAGLLRKLRIETAKVGLNVVAVYDKGTIYGTDVLGLAGEGYVDMLKRAHTSAVNLSVAAGYPTKENIKTLLAKAYREAKAIASKIKNDGGAS